MENAMTYFVIGLILGIFIPAPYDAIVRDNLTKLWVGIKNFFNADK